MTLISSLFRALIYNLFQGSHLQPFLRLILKPLPGLFIPASSGAVLFQASSGALISSLFWGSRFLPLLWLILNIFHGSSFKPLPGLSFPASFGALISSLIRALFPAASVVNTYTTSVALHFSLFQRSHFQPLQGLRLTLILMYQGLLMTMLKLIFRVYN